MGKKTRKNRNRKTGGNQQISSNSNGKNNPSTLAANDEPLAAAAAAAVPEPETSSPVVLAQDGNLCTPSLMIDKDNVESINVQDTDDQNLQVNGHAVQTNDSSDGAILMHSSPTNDVIVGQEDSPAVANVNIIANNGFCEEVMGCTDKTNEDDECDTIALPRPLVIAGPSGAGKGTLIGILMEKFSLGQFGFSVSHTTRQPREGEIDGVHYNFSTVEQMKREIDAGKFIESANVHGNYYGTSFNAVSSVQSKGQICILDIDVQGVQNVKKSSLNPYYVFIAPPSMDILEARLRGRGTDNEESIQKRLENARGEMEYGQEEGNFDMYLVNGDLKQAADVLCTTVKTWYPFLQEEEQQQQQQQQEQDDEVQSDKESKGEKVDVTNSCSGLEADLPDDEAKDEFSEAKTEVMDNTTDDAMLEDLDSCLDDDGDDACEAAEQPADRSEEEDHPEDEVDTDRITTSTVPKDNVLAVQIDEVISGDELNGNVTENKDADVDEEESTSKSNVDAVQNVVISTDNATKQSDEVHVNVAENKESVDVEDSIPNSNTGITQNVVIPTDNELNGNVTEIKGKLVEENSDPNPNADSAENIDVVVTTNNDTEQIVEVHGDELKSPITESKEIVVEGESTTPTANTDDNQTVSNNNNTAIFYTLQELKVPIDGVDWACREDYLSDDDIVKYFEMTREELKALPKWKRQAAKKKLGIF